MSAMTRVVRLTEDGEIRVPEGLLGAPDLGERVEVRAELGRLVVTAADSVRQSRQGWADEAREMRAAGDDRLLDPHQATSFDDEEWEW